MAVAKTRVMNVHEYSVANFILTCLPVILLFITESVQHPAYNKLTGGESFSIGISDQGSKNPEGDLFNGFMMIPKVYSDRDLSEEPSESLQNFQYHTIDRVYPDDNVGIVLLNDGKSYLNDVNEFEMDNLSSNRHDNVSVLQNDHLGNEDGTDQDDLVTWKSAALEENWWSICQLPVFVVLFAIIGVLAITFVVSTCCDLFLLNYQGGRNK